MGSVAAVVLAAGAGTRMKSKRPKVVHEILGKPLVKWVLDATRAAGITDIVTVVGHGRDYVIPLVEDTSSVVVQEEQLGTAHAVKCALDSERLRDFDGSVIILSGDCPLIASETISALASLQKEEGAGAVVLTMRLEDPFGYGRIIREVFDSADGMISTPTITRIVEQKDASPEEALICECNSGFYCFDARALRGALSRIGSDNAQGEFYLTDALELLRLEGYPTLALEGDDPTECLGVNSRRQLAEATAIKQKQINNVLMDSGVTMIDPSLVWCGPDVKIAQDCILHPNVTLIGDVEIDEDTVLYPVTMLCNTKVGSGCSIGPNTRIYDTSIGDNCVIDETYSMESEIDDGVKTGPRAYLRPGTHMCENSKAGTHVEIKNSTIGVGSKVPHLSYIGDTVMGSGVNIGAGTITCNYDGKNKHATNIGNNTFVGSDTMLVAPVTVGDDVVIGAGSVITKDVPNDSLAVARSREKIIEEWSARTSSKD